MPHTPRDRFPCKRLDASDGAPLDLFAFDLVPRRALRAGDLVLCVEGDVSLGEVVHGLADVGADGVVRKGHVVVRVTR